jgi:ABC-2 type transport system ATP-binding protein
MDYGPVRALDSVSFEAAQGQILGLLGPNGAGKTTAMNIIAGHLFPVSGTVTVGGHDVLKNPVDVRKLTGYLPEREPLYPDMEVGEFLRFVGKARGLTGKALKDRADWVLDACSLRPVYRKLLGDLSRGYRQRAGLAQALIHDPKVLILDELTSGLDPLQTSEVRKLVKGLAKGENGSGKCVIFSTHVMQEAQAVSDRIVIINHGRIVADGKPDEIRAQASAGGAISLCVEAPGEEVEASVSALPGVGSVEEVHCDKPLASFTIQAENPEELWRKLAELVRQKGWLVKELAPARPSLEDAFLALTRGEAQIRPSDSPKTPQKPFESPEQPQQKLDMTPPPGDGAAAGGEVAK